MEANEMFEKLGYKRLGTPFEDLFQYGEYLSGAISFDTTYKMFDTNCTVNIELYNAITQQMKELGWIE